MLAILMLYIGAHTPAAWILWTMVIVTVCRFLIVIGVVTSPTLDRPIPCVSSARFGTYLGGLVVSLVA